MLCDCSHRSAFVRAPGTDCPRPRTTVRGRNSRYGPDHSPVSFLEVFHRWNRQCASGVSTPDTDHPDSAEDREGSTSAIP